MTQDYELLKVKVRSLEDALKQATEEAASSERIIEELKKAQMAMKEHSQAIDLRVRALKFQKKYLVGQNN